MSRFDSKLAALLITSRSICFLNSRVYPEGSRVNSTKARCLVDVSYVDIWRDLEFSKRTLMPILMHDAEASLFN